MEIIQVKKDATFTTGLDNALWSTVDFTRHFQPVPVERRLFCERVVDIHRHRFPFT